MEFFATCPKGFERLLSQELIGFGCKQVRPLKGQVSFAGDVADAYRVCLWSRLASRVILALGRVDASSSDALYEGVRSFAWRDHLALGMTFAVDAHGTNAALRNTQFVALRAKDAIADELLARTGARPVVDTRNPGLTVVVRISRDKAVVGIDLSGVPLFKRGYESLPGKRAPIAPLRPDNAAALLASGGWEAICSKAREKDEVPTLFTLFPGAGSVLVEAAGIALDRAPGLARHRWGFEGWAQHDQDAWDRLLHEARERASASRGVGLAARETRKGSETASGQMLHAAGIDVAPRWLREGDEAGRVDLAVLDLSWVDADEPAVQAVALSQAARASLEARHAPMVSLSGDAIVDDAVGRDAQAVTSVFVGRDDACIRTYEAGVTRSLQSVEAGGRRIPVYVAASDQFAARLQKVAKQRAKWARREDVTCYRVYDADLPDYAVTIDRFEESIETARETPRVWLQMYEYAAPKGIDETLARKRLLDVLALAPAILGVDPRNVFLRTRQRSRGGSQYADEASASPHRGKSRMVGGAELVPGAHLVDEGGLTFEVNFSTRMDCGIFLDHRETRAMLREMAKRTLGSKRFLNLFAYTGSATCYAADGGMRHTTTVDLSRPSLDWARRNMARNGFAGKEHEFVQADVLAWISEQRHSANRWDLVFCDVPTFSNSQRMRKGSFDVQRDHVELLIGVSRLLTRGRDGGEGGTCVFSCNLRTFKPDVAALAKAGVAIEDITDQTIPEDFARNKRVHHCYLVRRS